ncbi:Peptidase M20, dimerization domain protein [Kalmanozyma brasiliensis GHG001]|uniref:Beta-alanine synthase n=1 Tax=Kalmanozyma brasiliensis (strain GHG001) TaxID=1365824 RepID=V5EWF3_KALBG|nr:Peptidase M20, dimerization domain protein [Kalmanozyma brasiliensis GHG001]EST07673.1 Peptidase M20, dimerization domain protein [Kalmanozyma brasiliensis GHG001]
MLAKPLLRTVTPLKYAVRPSLPPSSARWFTAGKLQINADRMMKTLHDTCEWGAAHRYGSGPFETGMARLTLDENDATVRRWLTGEAKKLGCSVTVDQMGNTFMIREGKHSGPPTAMGSHLDTQPTGGRYDGILGIMAGLEALRTMNDHNVQTEYPVALINWTNEEGARYPQSIVGSGVWCGDVQLEKAWALQDVKDSSLTMKSELSKIGFLGETKCSHTATPLAAHFELHIEQGPILEATGKKVGIVQGGQAYKWFDINVKGRECHTGSTPFDTRSDAMLCAARIIVESNKIAKEHKGLASTGILRLSPGSVNTCPGHVFFTLDVRHPSTDALAALCSEIEAAARRIAAEDSEKGCGLDWLETFHSPAITFHPDCIASVRKAAEANYGAEQGIDIYSGAGHDTCSTSKVCPSSMIFITSKDGISHNPREYSSPEDCAIGAQVLMDAALSYDSQRQG